MSSHKSSSQPDLSRGIVWLVVAVTIFVAQDSLSKYLTTRLPVLEIVWARYTFHLAAMLPLLLWYGPVRIALTSRPRLQIARALALLAASFTFVLGVRFLPLGTCTAITFAAPLVVTAVSAIFMKEKVGWRRWTAVLVGFGGVMAIVRPSGAEFSPVMLVPLATAVCNALYQLATRALSARDGALTTLLWTGVVGLLVMSPAMPWVWQSPDLQGWILLAAYGSLGFISHLTLILAYRHASASLLAPFFYVQLVLAMLSSAVFFGNLPHLWDLVGGLLICASGIYVWHRQRRLAAAASI